MQTEQCISVTELSKNTSSIIKRTPRVGVQYIFVNNKPKAVILSMQEYEKIEQERMVDFGTLEYSELSKETQNMYNRSKKLARNDFINF